MTYHRLEVEKYSIEIQHKLSNHLTSRAAYCHKEKFPKKANHVIFALSFSIDDTFHS
jgi:hypothetical protein